MFTNSFALDSFSVIPNRRISQAQNASSRAQHASEIQTPKVDSSRQKWTQKVFSDVKLLWNISVHVDIPAYEEYETMCLFHNHWSTTYEDLKLLRRKCKRREKHSKPGFLTFGGHWNRRSNTCEITDCFFGEGHKYVP